jgi:hypothetical protein
MVSGYHQKRLGDEKRGHLGSGPLEITHQRPSYEVFLCPARAGKGKHARNYWLTVMSAHISLYQVGRISPRSCGPT